MCSLNLNHLIAFTAPEFQAILTISFFVDFTQRILIEGFDLNPSFRAILNATNQSPLVVTQTSFILPRSKTTTCWNPLLGSLSLHTHSFGLGVYGCQSLVRSVVHPNLGGTWWTRIPLMSFIAMVSNVLVSFGRRGQLDLIEMKLKEVIGWRSRLPFEMYLCSCTSSACWICLSRTFGYICHFYSLLRFSCI